MEHQAEMANLEKVFDDFCKDAEKVIDKLPIHQKDKLLQAMADIEKKRQEREDLVKKCHPNDDHWPPHNDCPVCQKIFQRLENEAKSLLNEEDAKDEEKVANKAVELFEKKYLKGT